VKFGPQRVTDAVFAAWALGLLLTTQKAHAQAPAPVVSGALDAGVTASIDAGPRAPALAASSVGDAAQSALAVLPVLVPAASPSEPDPSVSPVPVGTVDVLVRELSKAQRQRESSSSVTVIELDEAKKQSADLGEVLARVQGISVRRAGGLGSYTRFSLNGLTDDQIRFFLDEVPLELAGYSQQIGDVPLLTLERVDVYRGVVPIRFGADALGGVVNLITPQPTRGYGSNGYYQIGSFGSHRAGLSGYYVHKPTGLFTRLSLYADKTQNDYPIEVDIPDATGRPARATVNRFHDAYRAAGASLELGFVKRPWAERLILRMFAMRLDNEIQNNQIMTLPYGEARSWRSNFGANLRYEQTFKERLRLEALAGYSYLPIGFVDKSPWVYNWRGERVRMRQKLGETEELRPYDRTIYQQSAFARVLLTLRLAEHHRVSLTLTPTYTTRQGEDRLVAEGMRDPLAERQSLFSLVSGLAYVLDAFDDVVENTLFVKHFAYRTEARERLPGNVYRDKDQQLSKFGAGDSLRVRLTPTLYTKASYEFTTRLPRPDEVFGNGALIDENPSLLPETSHNANFELTLDQPTARFGSFRGSLNGFLRDVDQQILLLGERTHSTYQNAYAAKAKGVEANAGWTSPVEYLALDGNATFLDFRNTSDQGTYGRYDGERLPSRPYLFANGTARGQYRSLWRVGDEISLSYYLRYVHSFYRGWESLGAREKKLTVPTQITHTLALIYSIALGKLDLSTAIEAQNLSNALVYDQFGAQKPGRAFYFKLSFVR